MREGSSISLSSAVGRPFVSRASHAIPLGSCLTSDCLVGGMASLMSAAVVESFQAFVVGVVEGGLEGM